MRHRSIHITIINRPQRPNVRLPAPIPPNQHLQEIRQLPERPLMRQHPPPINHKPHPKPRIMKYISIYNQHIIRNIEINMNITPAPSPPNTRHSELKSSSQKPKPLLHYQLRLFCTAKTRIPLRATPNMYRKPPKNMHTALHLHKNSGYLIHIGTCIYQEVKYGCFSSRNARHIV